MCVCVCVSYSSIYFQYNPLLFRLVHSKKDDSQTKIVIDINLATLKVDRFEDTC